MGGGTEMEIPLSNPQNTQLLRGITNTAGADTGAGNSGDRSAWQIRHQFVWVSHKKFGKISLGQTNAAANGASEANLTGTSSIGLSGGRPFVQGLGFIDETSGIAGVSTTSVGAAFSNFDMTSRTDVIRYDAPKFAGLSLAVSLNAGGGGEIGAKYSGKFGGVKILAKAGFTSLSATSTTLEDGKAFSIGLLHDSGLNVSFAIAEENLKNPTAGRDDPSMIYGSVGYKAKIFGVGGTNFNIRYQQTDDTGAQGNEATSVGFTIVQNFDSVGAQLGFNYQNYEFETATFTGYDDINTIALQAIFNF